MENTNNSISFERELNSAQLQAVMHNEGPLLVIAGAGSGKTRTLVYRVARLITDGVEPSSILLLTFTRKAAATMLERAAMLGGAECHKVHGGTFHGFCHRMLRKYAGLIGFSTGFTIMDQSDSQDLIHLLARQLEFSGKGKKFPTKGALCTIFSKCANTGSMVDEVIEAFYPHMMEHSQAIATLFQAYKDYKKAHALVDYDDLLLLWLRILRDFPEVRQTMSETYRFVMIDEYQDTNKAQAEIVRLMVKGHNNVMAVGDDSQSIYSFRGANFQNILDFPKIFPGTRIIKLEKNYRTTQPNLDCTNAIIANAKQKFTKRLTAHREGGNKPVLFMGMDEEEQARFIVETIKGYLEKGVDPGEIAVLFRAAFHSFVLETHLNRAGISFVKRGGMRLVDAAHIKDIICLLRLLINPLDRLSLNRILLLIDRLGPKSAERVYEALVASDSPLETLANFSGRAAWVKEVRGLGETLKRLATSSLDLRQLLDELIGWYRPYLESRYFDDYPKRLQELAQLKAMSSNYEDAVEFLADLALDPPEAGQDDEQGGKLVLSTIHSAKGLEWKVVFLISLCEGRFPSHFAENRPDEIEEERRLFYVAATRAKDDLYLCYPSFINVQGAGLMPARPSRFIDEIPERFLEFRRFRDIQKRRQTGGGRAKAQPKAQAGPKGAPGSGGAKKTKAGSFSPGDRVRHSIFGKGVVTEAIDDVRVKVLFDVAGEKTLRLDYTSLSLI
ncbi:MAG: ATP-dependent helicase [Thermodesulfobacteria bacterium]|nr:ATP-dependent helicase [Thermodesulfobacteriota bacterium]